MLWSSYQKKFQFPEPYNPHAQGIMPLHDELDKIPEYEIYSKQDIDKTRIDVTQNIQDLILQSLQPGQVTDIERRFSDRGGNN